MEFWTFSSRLIYCSHGYSRMGKTDAGENTEVREINGKYYLYKVHCKYNKETKTRKKIKPVYLGRLVEGKGLIGKGTTDQKIPAPSSIVEYEISAIVELLMDEHLTA